MLPVETSREPSTGLRRARTVVVPWPTPTGFALIVALAVAVQLSNKNTLAIGFLIPLAGLMVVDFALGALTVRHRPVSISLIRSYAETPSQELTFAATVPSGIGSLRVLARRYGPLSDDSDFVIFAPEDTSAQLGLGTWNARAGHHVRYRIEATHIGLAWARRWVTQETPATSIAPGPDSTTEIAAPVTEELDRLREYVPGDRISRVSWPTTARTGRLHVRAESPINDEITVVLDLGGDISDHAGTDAALRTCATVVGQLLDSGRICRLVTVAVVPKVFRDELERALERPYLRPRAKLKIKSDATATLDGGPAVQYVSELVPDRITLNRRLGYAELHPAMERPPAPYLLVTSGGVTHVQ